MTDIAKLGLEVDSSGITKAIDRNDKFAESAGKAEKSAKSFDGAGKKLSGTMGSLAKAAAPFVAAMASMASISNAITQARAFNSALAETSTLISGTADEMAYLSEKSRQLSTTFGGTATSQVSAFYQAISAGAGSVENAGKVLETANKLAIGGVTSVETSVDALTTAMNAYSASGLTAAAASDAMFVGIKAGKTTAAELASAMGQVVPIASSVGVSFDEVVASIAALTTQGQSTSQATTGVRQVLASIIKPTSQAADMADRLGISFDTQALKAQGLSGFLQNVVEKTGGSQEAMAQLFGSVEALNAVLAFSGSAGGTMVDILDQMEVKAGATDEAFEKVAQSLDQRLNVQISKFADAALSMGNMLLTVAVPALEAVTNNAGLAAAGLGALAVAAAAIGAPLTLVVGLLAGAGTLFAVMKGEANKAEVALYDAAKGSADLNEKLGIFYSTAAPSSGAAAINLANDNYKLADSAYAVAKAELEKQKAMLKIASTSGANGTSGSIRDMGMSASNEAPKYEAALERMEAAEKALAQAMNDRKRAATAVTGADYSEVTSNITVPTVDVSSGGKKGSSAGGLAGAAAVTDDFAARLEALQNGLMTEREAVDAWYEESQLLLADRRANELLSEEEHKEALLRVEETYQQQLAAINANSGNQRLKDTSSLFGALAAVTQSGGKKLEKISRGLAAAQGVINSYLAFTEVLKDPSFVGRPLARFAAASAALASGLSAVASIKSGSSSGGSSSSATSHSTTSEAASEPAQQVVIEGLNPDALYTGAMLQDLFDALQGEGKDRGIVPRFV